MNNILVITPHASRKLPKEVKLTNIRKSALKDLNFEVDECTDKLYDFKKYFNNDQISFGYHRGIIDAQDHPNNIKEAIPLKTFFDKDIYLKDLGIEERQLLLNKYHKTWHEGVANYLKNNLKPLFIIDGHSTSSGDVDDYGDRFEGDITLGSWQRTKWDKGGFTRTCSDKLIETFGECLQKYIKKVNLNSKYVCKTYGYIEERYSKFFKNELLLIETNEKLYIKSQNRDEADEKNLKELNKIFAYCIKETINKLTMGSYKCKK
jgi:N-formylglutamate amidohydrolase